MTITIDQWHEAMAMTSRYIQPESNRKHIPCKTCNGSGIKKLRNSDVAPCDCPAGDYWRAGCKHHHKKEETMPNYYETIGSEPQEKAEMKTFKSGATRDGEDGKLDFEGFLSPLALTRYAEYLDLHRTQSDGKVRASDNWQKGIPTDSYVKSMFRHFIDLWTMHRGHIVTDRKDGHVIDGEEALCAVIFNAFGLLHETLVDKGDPAAQVGDLYSGGRCSSCYVHSSCERRIFRSGVKCDAYVATPAEAAIDVQVQVEYEAGVASKKCTHNHATWFNCIFGFASGKDRMCHIRKCTKVADVGNKKLTFGLPPDSHGTDIADYPHGGN